ncbi:MAG: 2-amino-4-ketopentanoate thiolase [Gammaproteobacteria bacterium]|nr:2-amino-4-ketopentanoate thiolase [Gammaproteobacteria bacterium]
MTERVAAGTWVEIYRVVLAANERAPQLPEDTRQVPLEMRVKGWLVKAAELNGDAEIKTPAGRQLRGTLVEINPAYRHGFGSPIPELTPIGNEVRALLRTKGWFT